MSRTFQVTATAALVLSIVTVGCARHPSVTSPAASSPAPAAAAQAGPGAPPAAPGSASVAIADEQEVAVAERPAPATFAENAGVNPIYFDFDRYEIRPGDARTLEANAAWLKTHEVLILIEGQCDERGTDDYNLALGDRRARATRDYLTALGVAADRIRTVSYGRERPVCSEHTEACWALNRRAHVVVAPRG